MAFFGPDFLMKNLQKLSLLKCIKIDFLKLKFGIKELIISS